MPIAGLLACLERLTSRTLGGGGTEEELWFFSGFPSTGVVSYSLSFVSSPADNLRYIFV